MRTFPPPALSVSASKSLTVKLDVKTYSALRDDCHGPERAIGELLGVRPEPRQCRGRASTIECQRGAAPMWRAITFDFLAVAMLSLNND